MKKIALSFALSLMIVFGFFGSAFAAAPFSDSFDSYSNGALNGQGSWGASYSNVQTTYAKSGKAASCENTNCYGYKGGTETTSGTWYFWFKVDVPAGGGYSNVIFYRNGFGGQFQVVFYADGSNIKACDVGQTQCITGLTAADWHYLAIDWNDTQFRFKVDWGTYTNFINRSATNGGIHGMQFQNTNPNSSYWYIDEISDTEESEPAPPDTITITYPNTTPAYFDHMTVSYHIDASHAGFGRADVLMCGGDVIACRTLCQNGYNAQYGANCWKIINTSGCAATSTDEIYDRTLHFSSMMASLQNATSTPVLAKAYLFAADPAASPHCAFTGSIYDLETSPEWLASSADLAVQFDRSGIENSQMQEDCSAYSGLDKVICDMKNFLLGAILPSNGAITQFQNTLALFNNKFPMSYITPVVSLVGDVWAGINENAAITLTIFGNTGNLDTSIFDLTIPNTAFTLGQAIKAFFFMIAIMVFLSWAIGYMHRLPQVA